MYLAIPEKRKSMWKFQDLNKKEVEFPGVSMKNSCEFLLVLKPWGGFKVDSAFLPSKIDKMSTRNLWELSGKK